MFEMKLPDIGEGVAEAELVSWKVSAGQMVKENEALAEFLTDKASVDIPSPVDGVVQPLKFNVGDIIQVGDIFIQIDDEQTAATQAEVSKTPEVAPEPTVKEPSESTKEKICTTQVCEEKLSDAPPQHPPRPGHQKSQSQSSSIPLASPSVRAEAKRKNIDLSQIIGSGPNGRVLSEDLNQSSEPQTKTPSEPDLFPPGEDEENWSRQPFIGIRRKIAENMQLSKRTIPHFTYVEEVDVTKLEELRSTHPEFSSPLPFIAMTCIRALQTYPILNSSLDTLRNELIHKSSINLGIAVATDQGLVVPVVHQAQTMCLTELTSQIKSLSTRAKQGKIEAKELKGGSFTISSLGKFGGLMATPIIRHPEVAILGVHSIKKQLQMNDAGEIVQHKVFNLSLSVDHRIADGIVAAQFIQHIKDRLEIAGFAELVEKHHDKEE